MELKAWVIQHKKIVVICAAVLLVGGGAALALTRNRQPISRLVPKLGKAKAEPKTKSSPLTGLAVEPAQAERPITGVVIENHPNARPQSGLQDAGVVYEALAEGGITRFLAFYLEKRPGTMGPIRSLRTYFVDWALEFNAPVAHVGGNADALDIVQPLGMKDMNEFAHGSYFYRSNDRYAPHNMYSSSDSLDKLQQALGFYKPAEFKPSPRKKDQPAKPASHPAMSVNYSYPGFEIEYRYDTASNEYLRFMAGQPHIDRNNGQQIRVKNVVVQYMPTSFGFTRIGEATVIMGTPGSGKAVVFRDGKAIEGTWSKSQHRERTKLLDRQSKEIKLNRGNTWYSIVPNDRSASY